MLPTAHLIAERERLVVELEAIRYGAAELSRLLADDLVAGQEDDWDEAVLPPHPARFRISLTSSGSTFGVTSGEIRHSMVCRRDQPRLNGPKLDAAAGRNAG